MNEAEKEKSDAEMGLFRLWQRMVDGDAEAAEFIRDIAIKATQHLSPDQCKIWLVNSDRIEALPKVEQTIKDLAHHSDEWPIVLNSIHELRKIDLEKFSRMKIGSRLAIKPGGAGSGRSRKIETNSPAGFALTIYQIIQAHRKRAEFYTPENLAKMGDSKMGDFPEIRMEWLSRPEWQLDAEKLPNLDAHHKTQDLWVIVMVEVARNMAGGNLETAHCPAFIHKRATQMIANGSKSRPIENAIREAFEKGIASLLHI